MSAGQDSPPPQRDDTKRLANLKARACLQGVELHVIDGDDGGPEFICIKWAMTKRLRSLDELAAWVSMVDGRTER